MIKNWKVREPGDQNQPWSPKMENKDRENPGVREPSGAVVECLT